MVLGDGESCRGGPARRLADHDLHGRFAPRSHHRSMVHRRREHGETFLLYIKKVLVPTLRHGDIVIMGNLGSHKANAVRRAIRAAGARLFYLPKYSPDLNPIEQFFAKFKHWLRKATREPPRRTTMLSLRSSKPFRRLNAPTISLTPDMTKSKLIPL
jgi:transposase